MYIRCAAGINQKNRIMDGDPALRDKITRNLILKANLQQQVYDNTFAVFNELKEILHEMSAEMSEQLEEHLDKRVRIEYRDRGKYEAQIQTGGEVLIFVMHTNVFRFDRDHVIWTNPYVSGEPLNVYCGMINVYNFLADSFKFSRNSDEGYMTGRIFVNRNLDYFVEGKGEHGPRHFNFGQRRIDKAAIIELVESAIDHALDFDLLVPPYDAVKTVNVEQLNTKFENSKIQTGKRLGYCFNTDDV